MSEQLPPDLDARIRAGCPTCGGTEDVTASYPSGTGQVACPWCARVRALVAEVRALVAEVYEQGKRDTVASAEQWVSKTSGAAEQRGYQRGLETAIRATEHAAAAYPPSEAGAALFGIAGHLRVLAARATPKEEPQ